MTLDQKISLFYSIITAATSVIVLLTLFEIAKQRKSSYKPDIFLASQNFYAQKSGLAKSMLPIAWSEYLSVEHNYQLEYLLNIYNIGNGSAKNISVQWNLELDEIIGEINLDAKDINYQLHLEKNDDSQIFIVETIDNEESTSSVNTKLDLNPKYDYLLPSSVDKEGLKIRLPATIIFLIAIRFMLWSKKSDRKYDKIFPWIGMTISYEDIGGSKHVKGFKFDFSLIMHSETTFGGRIEAFQTTS